MTRFRTLVLLAAGGSLALLLGAFFFQYVMGLAPCKLCIWQRWPHVIAVLVGAAALTLGNRALAWLGALAAATTGGFGIYHAGVEKGWWDGPSTCTSTSPAGMSADDFFDKVINAPLIRCDEVAWSMMGLSMASWNAVIAFALALIWIRAAVATR
ncbi:disulfide bond formation protein B [Pseudooceanicola sp.]|uniref:disulfide bond formation protein B n=1 Tax=Pseudooceanicola sp. TaxID=1914328 RepID=UPI0035C6B412